MTVYMCTTNGKGNFAQYWLPSFTHTLCQKVWPELLILPRKKMIIGVILLVVLEIFLP